MGEDYDRVVAAVSQLVALGATRVRIGDVEVEFGPRPRSVVDILADSPADSEENDLDGRKRWEEEQYLSAGPVSAALLRRMGGK